MRLLITSIYFLIAFNTLAAVKTTISNGSWFDPTIWSPIGVPLMEDTVVVNHNVIVVDNYVDFGAQWLIVNSNASIIGDTIFALHGNLKLYGLMNLQTIAVGDGDSTQVYGTILGRKYIPGNPANFNYSGLIQSDSLVLGENFENYGTIDVMSLILGGPNFINHSGSNVNVSVMATFGGPCNNFQNGMMDIEYLITSENMVNNGDVVCRNWTHAQGTVNGTTGRYCISDCFVNISSIQGTIDVCDETPGGFCDMNMGTISGTVTQCTQGSCITNAMEEITLNKFEVSPNPATYYLNIVLNQIEDVEITDLSGRVIISLRGQNKYTVDVSDWYYGNYLIKSKNVVKRISVL